MSTIKSKKDLEYTVNDDDLIPLVDGAGAVAKSVTPGQLNKTMRSSKHVTIGDRGDYPDLTTAFPVERDLARFDTVYAVGQVTLTDGDYLVTPIGGATFLNIERGSFYIRIIALDLFIPCVVIAPLAENRTRTKDFAILKYKWDNGTGNYDYEIIRPLHTHFEILPGHVVEPVADDNGLVIPNFTSLGGIDKTSCIWNGAMDMKPNEAGVSISGITWGNNEGMAQESVSPFSTAERAMIRVKGDYAPFDANYHADIHIDNILSGLNNSERDGIIFGLPRVAASSKHNGIGTVMVRNNDIYAYWDTIVVGAENFIIQNNRFVQRSYQDYADPTCLVMWRNYRPDLVKEIQLQFQNNSIDLFNDNSDVSTGIGILMPDNFNQSVVSPSMTGIVSGNNFKARVANIATTKDTTFMSMGSWWVNGGDQRILADNNLHDIRQIDGTTLTPNYRGAQIDGVCPVEVGNSDRNSDGSAIVKEGTFLNNDNLEWV